MDRREPRVLDLAGLDALIAALRAQGREVLGPRVRDGAVVQAPLRGVDDLPGGVRDEQAPGRYRLVEHEGPERFSYAVGPHAWRRVLQVPEETLWESVQGDEGLEIRVPPPEAPPRAFLGVRACELAAMEIQDRVLRQDDPRYAARRGAALVVAVECGAPAATCFCPSMGTGPEVSSGAGADLVLTELADEGGHRFLVRADSEDGAALLAALDSRPATDADRAAAAEVPARARAEISRRVDADAARDQLPDQADAPRWQEVAARCLACANCTMVCPTCFCTSAETVPSLDPAVATQARRWASCFEADFSYLHGGPVRATIAGRYRQWLTHKFSTWHQQFDTAGCVGCGRCITWCPPGIDVTEELAALLGGPGDEEGEGPA